VNKDEDYIPRSITLADFLVVVSGFTVNIIRAFEAFASEILEIAVYHANRKTKVSRAWEQFTSDLEKMEDRQWLVGPQSSRPDQQALANSPRRTDLLAMPSAAYGEGVETAAIKAGAPMAKTPDVSPTTCISEVRDAASLATSNSTICTKPTSR
jgi:hypothetical protein